MDSTLLETILVAVVTTRTLKHVYLHQAPVKSPHLRTNANVQITYTPCLKSVHHFYFHNNFSKHWPIFVIFFTLKFEKICRENLIYKVKLSVQIYSFTFILTRIICCMSCSICFVSVLSADLFFLPNIITLAPLWYHLEFLFVASLMPFNFDNKCLARHWTMHNWCIYWLMACTTTNMYTY